MKKPVLETAAQEFAEATAVLPYSYQLAPDEGRKGLEDLQSGDDLKPGAELTDLTIDGGPTGTLRLRLVTPPGVPGPLPVIHRLVRELAVGARAAVLFPDYDRSPEAKYPTAIEQCWTTAQWINSSGAQHGLDPSRVLIAGDSVGGNMTAAVTLLAKQRGGVSFAGQVLFYPVTNAGFDTDSYHQFADGHDLVLGPVHL